MIDNSVGETLWLAETMTTYQEAEPLVHSVFSFKIAEVSNMNGGIKV